MNIVTLIEELVNGLIAAEDIFFQNPKDFYSLEKSVKSTTEAFSAAFLGNVLTSMNEKIYEDRWRKTRYTAQRTDKPIQDLQTFVLGNWSAVMRTYHSKVITGCSAESHVSHVLSDRLSSRPMGWSKTGADRMSKLRCYEKNYGREKIIDLVKYSRQQRKLARTGTDSVEPIRVSLREIRADHYNQARSYIERIQATIPDGTVRKIAAIREQIRLI